MFNLNCSNQTFIYTIVIIIQNIWAFYLIPVQDPYLTYFMRFVVSGIIIKFFNTLCINEYYNIINIYLTLSIIFTIIIIVYSFINTNKIKKIHDKYNLINDLVKLPSISESFIGRYKL